MSLNTTVQAMLVCNADACACVIWVAQARAVRVMLKVQASLSMAPCPPCPACSLWC